MVRRIVRASLFLASLLALAATAQLATQPRAVDWVEATALTHATAFARGTPAYTEPAVQGAPAMMPGLPLLIAPLVAVAGPEPWQPRAVALVSLAALAVLVLLAVRLETASWTLAVTSVGFLAFGLDLVCAPPGLALPELVMLPFVLGGVLALRLSDDYGGPLLGGLLFALAFFVSPQAEWFAFAAMLALALDDPRRLLVFTLTHGLLVGGTYLLLWRTWGPWFAFGAWGSPLGSVELDPAGPLLYVGGELLGKLGVLTIAAVLSFALPTAPWRGKGGLWTCLALAAFAQGLAATQVRGAAAGLFVPSVAALAVLGPVAMQRVLGHLSAWPGSDRVNGQGLVLTALTLQFVMFFADSLRLVGVQ